MFLYHLHQTIYWFIFKYSSGVICSCYSTVTYSCAPFNLGEDTTEGQVGCTEKIKLTWQLAAMDDESLFCHSWLNELR